jgi:small subunit ribosomal protein S8
MINDHVSDMITRIRNGQRAGHRSVLVTVSKLNRSILEVLKREGFIEGFEAAEDADKKPALRVALRYYSSGKPLVSRVERVSKPGCRRYCESSRLPKVSSGLGLAIVSTSRGVMSDAEARRIGVGGEVIARVG